jgi:hypothetical protein
MKLLEENGKMYGYEITQKVKAYYSWANSILPKVLVSFTAGIEEESRCKLR